MAADLTLVTAANGLAGSALAICPLNGVMNGRCTCGSTRVNLDEKEGSLTSDVEMKICKNTATAKGKCVGNGEFVLGGDARDRNRTCTPFGTGT